MERLGKYELCSKLGGGAMGLVYLGLDTTLDRTVAIKTIHAHLLTAERRDTLLERFRREAQTAARCLHPNLVTVFDFEVDGDVPYIVMEYVEGEELEHLLRSAQRLELAEAARLMGQLLDGLDFAHSHGIVHRDIKPSNVFVTREGCAKLGDFGIAHVDSSLLTQDGALVGTPSYMSPEQLDGAPVDGRSDLYSAGIVLFELITGARPHQVTPAMLRGKESIGRAGPPSALNPSIPEAWDRVLAKALALRPEERFATAGEFRKALLLAAQEPALPSSDETITYPGQTTQAGAARSSPSMLGAETLAALEAQLVKDVGPMAHILLERASRHARSEADLFRSLAEDVSDPVLAAQFLARAEAPPAAPSGGGMHGLEDTLAPSGGLGPRDLEEVIHHLAFFVGPMATILVERVAGRMTCLSDLHAELAELVPAGTERTQFLERVRGA